MNTAEAAVIKSRSRNSEWIYHAEIMVSAAFFALSTLLAKLVERDHVTAFTITFFRFAIGLAILLVYMALARSSVRPRNPVVLVLRGVFNLLAVFLFYYAIKYTTITNANVLNMTYPVFVALLSPLVLSERLVGRDWGILAIAGFGICLIVNPNFTHVNIGDLIGLGAGFTGGLAVLALCFARRDNTTTTVLLFMLGVGTLVSWPGILGQDFTTFTPTTWLLLGGCGATGVIGQFAITHGFRHLSAFAGSVTGMSRVIMAAALGFFFLGEVPTWNTIAGSGILFAAIYLLASSGPKDTSVPDIIKE